MKKMIIMVMLSGLMFASFGQNDTTETNTTQPIKQEKPLKTENLQCQLGDLASSNVTIEQILEQSYVKIVPEMDEPQNMEIISFLVIFSHNGYEDPPILCKGNQLSETVKEKIKQLPVGSILFLENVKVNFNGRIRALEEKMYRIVEKK